MKKNTLVAIIIIIFDIIIILLTKIILSNRNNYRIILPSYKMRSNVAYRKKFTHPHLKKRYSRHMNAKSSNDELIELIKQFFGGKEK
ncbi:hypothetical protein [Thomasclavelia cocleata]|uniref:hypothetical protein n=1 Tax=Thomasclavelia cocleata TaxID=69824 RepID=UPI0025A9F25A|nr:hypothetical protein [Thomasclavelia cocleata]